MTESLARCRDVSVVHRGGGAPSTALAHVDFEVRARERVSLVGRSGSGKTTLLHVLGGLVEPTSGTVEWKGRPLDSLDAAARRTIRGHGIAYVFQGANLLPYFSALENVAFAAAHGGTAERSPEELLGLVGLGTKAGHLPAELSGGERQRVAVARAVAQRPELLLCDEPTGYLDSDTASRVLDLLDALQAELGLALLIATHDSAVAARFDRVVELHDGKIASEGVLA
jgi:ABC-type lipoprotein export system ATPase subunit